MQRCGRRGGLRGTAIRINRGVRGRINGRILACRDRRRLGPERAAAADGCVSVNTCGIFEGQSGSFEKGAYETNATIPPPTHCAAASHRRGRAALTGSRHNAGLRPDEQLGADRTSFQGGCGGWDKTCHIPLEPVRRGNWIRHQQLGEQASSFWKDQSGVGTLRNHLRSGRLRMRKISRQSMGRSAQPACQTAATRGLSSWGAGGFVVEAASHLMFAVHPRRSSLTLGAVVSPGAAAPPLGGHHRCEGAFVMGPLGQWTPAPIDHPSVASSGNV